jgi:hypothetical protein
METIYDIRIWPDEQTQKIGIGYVDVPTNVHITVNTPVIFYEEHGEMYVGNVHPGMVVKTTAGEFTINEIGTWKALEPVFACDVEWDHIEELHLTEHNKGGHDEDESR